MPYLPSTGVLRRCETSNVGQYDLPAAASAQTGAAMAAVVAATINPVALSVLVIPAVTRLIYELLSFVSTMNCCGSRDTYKGLVILMVGTSASIVIEPSCAFA